MKNGSSFFFFNIMNLDNDIFHVVIRLPYKRPPRFIEPLSIVWTNEMEHKLWQYMSQKNTNWNEMAEQLGVPTSYVVRHAAFIYETQLRGIHQQLRLNTPTTGPSRTNSIKSMSRPVRYSELDTLAEKSKETIQSDQSSTSTIRHRILPDPDSHVERIKHQVEEPAFLPHQPTTVDHDLGNSRQQLSLSIQNLRNITLETGAIAESPIQPTHPPPETTSHSMGSSFSDLSDSSVTQSALEEAFLSKFNQGGSKMSLMHLSRKT
ncbi:hypothetical protein BD560DRAFT_392126 [Blakeslea trispora]|nr:hypothetical protein BD560DRAFT_392126 [Blakeslea trispora]